MLIRTNSIVNDLVGFGQSNGTFGELLQGVTTNNKNFLVTLPISLSSETKFTSINDFSEIITFPSTKIKASKLATKILRKYNFSGGGILDIKSNIPVGKGLASSSADLVATARAISNTFNIELSNLEIQSLLKDIEPSDGVMYDGIVSFQQKECKLIKKIGATPKLTIIAIDEGGHVDTVKYNNYNPPFYNELEKLEYDCLLEVLTKGIQNEDLEVIGKVATKSAILNQKFNHKDHLEEVLYICNKAGGLGVVIAHSGTYSGILLSQECEYYKRKLDYVYHKLKSLKKGIRIFYTI
ncbi:kinase [Oceanobacillus kimchii]|uniref:GHMP family kinase ATP-binding protein n=1 Tax=Oceanobacillus kimchii TaxID=746691 RepID=UPI003B029365